MVAGRRLTVSQWSMRAVRVCLGGTGVRDLATVQNVVAQARFVGVLANCGKAGSGESIG